MALTAPPPGWSGPARTIAIAALQRTGSNLLSELMGQTGRLGRPVEFFNPNVLGAVFPGRGGDMADRCRLAREEGATANGVVAIKFFPEHFRDMASAIRFSAWFGTTSWVWLRRRDLLGQAISLVMARQREAFASSNSAKREASYSGHAIAAAITEIATRSAFWETYFARTGIEPLMPWYEDVEADGEAAVRSIAERAGIDLGPFQLAPPAIFLKQRDETNDAWRRRFRTEFGDPDQAIVEGTRGRRDRLRRLIGRFAGE